MKKHPSERHELEDYVPGVTRKEAHAALLKVAWASNPNPKRDRTKNPSSPSAEAMSGPSDGCS